MCIFRPRCVVRSSDEILYIFENLKKKYIKKTGPAVLSGQLAVGDEILAVDGAPVTGIFPRIDIMHI